MYSSNSNGNNIPISYTLDQTLAHKSIFSENNPNPKQYDIPSSLFSLPSPYTQYDEYPILLQYFPDLLLQQQPHLMTNDDTTAEAEAEDEAVITTVDSDRNGADGVLKGDFNMRCESVATEQIQRKRSSKKDRHSKINTAHGLRDRRMRLSLEVARKFFDLQDMLGFDKASKTVEWLLIKSKIAIKELAIGLKHTSSSNGAHSGSPVSECEVVSGDVDHTELISKRSKPSNGGVLKEKKIKSRVLHKSPFHPLAREWREKARAKARARTREKRKLDESKICLGAMNQNLNQLGSWSSYEACEDLGNHSQNVINQSIHEVEELRSQEHQGARQGILGDCLVINSNWSPSINFNYQHNTGTSQEFAASIHRDSILW